MSQCQQCAREFTPVSGYETSLDTRASECAPCREALASRFLAIYGSKN